MHLFDIDIPGKISFKESETLSPGQRGTVVNTPHGTIAIGICYDLRFPELAQLYAKKGANIVIYPGENALSTSGVCNQALRAVSLACCCLPQCCTPRWVSCTDLGMRMGSCPAGAFNTTTGPLHWELLLRARATDNQLFVAACSPARNEDASYHVRSSPNVCCLTSHLTAG